MISIRKLVGALCLASCCLLSNAAETVTHNISDDGHSEVPLQFSFPFYGLQFNNSWMYDNGVISFIQPGSPGALAPWQWDSRPLNTFTGANYFIAPLWSDLSPVTGTTFYTTSGDSTFQKYTWNNISEFYSGGTRFNTFSVTLRPDGSIRNSYTGINITQSNVSVGTVGDSSKGEHDSIYFFSAGTSVSTESVSDWERYTAAVDQCLVDPSSSTDCPAYFDAKCSQDPLYDPLCSGYFDAKCSQDPLFDSTCPNYFSTKCSQDPLYDSACPGYSQAFLQQQCSLNSLYSPECPGYFDAMCMQNPLYDVKCPGYGAAFALQNMSSESESTDVEILSTNTQQIQDTELPAEYAVTVDVGGVELSLTGEISAPTGQPAVAKESTESSETQESQTRERRPVDRRAVSLALLAAREAENAAKETAEDAVELSQSDMATSTAAGLGTGITLHNFRPMGLNDESSETVSNQSSSSAATVRDQDNRTITTQETAQRSGPSVRGSGKVEGMEGGPDPDALAASPMDFNQYLNLQLLDSQFYQSRDIYRGQRNVDNQRLLRGLTGGSDRLHQEMINEQYK